MPMCSNLTVLAQLSCGRVAQLCHHCLRMSRVVEASNELAFRLYRGELMLMDLTWTLQHDECLLALVSGWK